jgi:hypothetical protein
MKSVMGGTSWYELDIQESVLAMLTFPNVSYDDVAPFLKQQIVLMVLRLLGTQLEVCCSDK